MLLVPAAEDLTAYARIRNAALELFATRGVGGTTIRDVAKVAGVSPGLVQHHFGTKDGLRRAVDEYVLADALSTITDLPGELEDRTAEFASRMGAVIRDRPYAVLYMARSASEGGQFGLAGFKAIVEFGVPQLEQMDEAGQLVPNLDYEWTVLQFVIHNLATVMFEPAISHALGQPLFSEEGRQRWNAAAESLFTRGFTRTPAPRGRSRSRKGRR
jgi:TetR/AcrR family transcriptional regulator, regulator of cefoperazone and chloramphenicol sensitivity